MKTPGDRAMNHGGVGWVDPAPPDELEMARVRRDIRKASAMMATMGGTPDIVAVGETVLLRCESCGELDPTVKHRERTGGPDGNLCDECDEEVSRMGSESPQF